MKVRLSALQPPADRPASLVRDSPRDGTRRHTARLKQDDRAIVGKRRRNARRLAGAGLGFEDERPALAHARDDLGKERVYRKRLPAHSQPIVPASGCRDDAVFALDRLASWLHSRANVRALENMANAGDYLATDGW